MGILAFGGSPFRKTRVTATRNRLKTRSSADADKPVRRYMGTIRYIRYGFLLVCYSKFVPKLRHFSDRFSVNFNFDFKKCRDFEIRVRVHLRLLKVVPFDILLWFPITIL